MENKILYFDKLDSTNTKVRELALSGAESGTVVVADVQTAGKGRRGRSWESPAGTNIYMSILLKPNLEPVKAPMVTLVMAYSVAKVLKGIGFDNIQIKWPNDLILSGKKVCGILTEMELDGTDISHVVVGVGINVNTVDFSEEIVDKATSFAKESGKQWNRKELTEKIAEQFLADFGKFLEEKDLAFLQDEYNEMLVNRDKEVRVLQPGNEFEAVALGINQVGELLVRKMDGQEEAIFAGEVSVRGIYGYI